MVDLPRMKALVEAMYSTSPFERERGIKQLSAAAPFVFPTLINELEALYNMIQLLDSPTHSLHALRILRAQLDATSCPRCAHTLGAHRAMGAGCLAVLELGTMDVATQYCGCKWWPNQETHVQPSTPSEPPQPAVKPGKKNQPEERRSANR